MPITVSSLRNSENQTVYINGAAYWRNQNEDMKENVSILKFRSFGRPLKLRMKESIKKGMTYRRIEG